MKQTIDDAYIWILCACCGKNVGVWESELGDEDFICADCEDFICEDEE